MSLDSSCAATKHVIMSMAVILAMGIGRLPLEDPLVGTAWQLVSFRSADGQAVTPDDRAKYTIRFGTGGELIVRVDCNRGRGKWESAGSQLRLGPLALTRMKCPQGSMHDLFVKHWTTVASYNIKDGHLFLSLEGHAGSYEFEPTKAGQ